MSRNVGREHLVARCPHCGDQIRVTKDWLAKSSAVVIGFGLLVVTACLELRAEDGAVVEGKTIVLLYEPEWLREEIEKAGRAKVLKCFGWS